MLTNSLRQATSKYGVGINGWAGQQISIYKNIPSTQTVIVGFAFNERFGSVAHRLVEFWDVTGLQGYVQLATGVLQYYRNDGLFAQVAIGDSYGSVSGLVWHYLEIKIKFANSGGTLQVRLDGLTVINNTGLDTRGDTAGSDTCTQVRISSPGSGTNDFEWYDDVYICDTNGSYCNDFPGDVKVLGVLPDGNGTKNDFTQNAVGWPGAGVVLALGQQILDSNGNVQQVTARIGDFKTGASAPTWATTLGQTTTDNNVTWTCIGTEANWMLAAEPDPDEDNSYVGDGTVGDQDRYVYPAISGSQVHAVVPNLRVKKDDAGSRAVRGVAKSGSSIGDNGTDLAVGGGYAYLQAPIYVDPATGAAWTVPGVNAAEFGVKVTA